MGKRELLTPCRCRSNARRVSGEAGRGVWRSDAKAVVDLQVRARDRLEIVGVPLASSNGDGRASSEASQRSMRRRAVSPGTVHALRASLHRALGNVSRKRATEGERDRLSRLELIAVASAHRAAAVLSVNASLEPLPSRHRNWGIADDRNGAVLRLCGKNANVHFASWLS